jgi:gliding motility-associated-like protein
MKKILFLITSLLYFSNIDAQCDVSANASATTITCGQSVTLTAFGQSSGAVILNENFNSGGFGSGWGSTPGATSFSNPCSPGGVDGTPHAWMDNNTSVPRTLTSQSYNLTSATAGVTVCFDLLFATQGDAAPCEGPDEPDEGVYLQYSTDGGTTWININYFDPNGGNDPQLTNWNNWCFALPPGAITGNTIIRWHQIADSGADYDHWGIDNVQIYQNDVNATLVWLHDGYSYGVGNPGGPNPNTVSPTTTTTYTAQLTTGAGTVCTQSVTVTVVPPTFDVNITANPTSICSGDCSNITATALEIISPASTPTFENNEFALVASGSASVNINVQGLNTTSLVNGTITSVCINSFSFSGNSLCTNFGGCPCNGGTVSFGQSCNLTPSGFTVTLTAPGGCTITLVPAGIANGNYNNVCFVPSGGTALSPGFQTGGTFNPNQSLSGLNGCNPNGVWTLEFSAPGLGIGIGTLTGWEITFDDPAITGPVSFVWSPTTNMTNANTLTPTVCPTASTTYSLTVSNPTPGCPSYTESIPITVTNCGTCTPPTFTVTPPAAVCAPNTINLAATVSGAGVNIISYHSTNADANADTNPLASSTVSSSGTYFIRVEDPTDSNCFTVQSVTVTINPLVSLTVTPPTSNICAGDNVNLTANGATNYTWANATGLNTTTGATVTASPATTTTYTVTGTSGTCSGTATATITISPNLIISVTPPSATICAGTSVNLTATGATNYTWTNATGLNTTTGATVTASPATTTTYTVTGTSGTCTGDTTVTITVSPNLLITVTPPNATICAGDNVNLTASGASNYTWTNAAGLNTTTGAAVTASPATTTTYTVTGTSGTCTGDTTVTITVSPNLVISVTPPNATICSGDNVSLTASGATNYTWTNAAGLNTTTGATVTASPATTTTYTVTGTSGTCTGDTTITITVSPNLVISVTPPNATICAGDNVSLTASGATNYTWANAAGLNTTSGATVTASPATTTTYTVTGTSGTCTGDTTVTITVSPNLLVSVTPPNATICSGDNVSLTASGATNYTWANAAGLNTTTGATVTASPATTTTYTVTGTSGTCTGDTTVTITVSPAITITTNPGDTSICAGDDLQITASGATNYSWSPTTGLNTGTGATVIASPAVTTTYIVTGSNGTCTSDTTITITVVAQPIVTATANPSTICAGANSILTGAGATTYTWAPGATLSSTTGSTVTATPPTTTQYTLIGANGNCTASTTVTVTVIPVTNANATNNDTICIGESAQLGVSSGNTFAWSPATGLNNPTIANPIATPSTTTTYIVTVSNNGLCASTDTVTIVVNPIPNVNAGSDITINNDEILILNGTGQGSLLWTDNGFLLSCYTCTNPSANPTEDTYYILTTTDANGCTNSDTVNITVTDFYGLFVPNAFTPTGTIGSNDFFMAKGYGIKEFQMMIFNRWGEKIFETNDLYTGWDGTYKGKIVAQDVYVYKIFAIPISGNEIQRIGSVTVVR